MRWLGYTWTVAVNCFYLFIIVWVFDKLTGRRDLLITVSILGLIYVTIRTISMYQFAAMFETFTATRKQMAQLQLFVRDPSYEENQRELEGMEELKGKSVVKFYINGIFLGLIGLFCMVVLFTTLSSMPSPY